MKEIKNPIRIDRPNAKIKVSKAFLREQIFMEHLSQ